METNRGEGGGERGRSVTGLPVPPAVGYRFSRKLASLATEEFPARRRATRRDGENRTINRRESVATAEILPIPFGFALDSERSDAICFRIRSLGGYRSSEII